MERNKTLMIAEKVNLGVMRRAKALVPEYIDKDPVDIVKDVIEKHLIFRPVASDDDIRDAISIEKDLGFDDISDWVSYTLRKLTEPYLPSCDNCNYLQDDYFCPKLGYKVNPNFCGKSCFAKKP